MLSCSTCWNSGRNTNGQKMLTKIKALGFDRIELGHGIRLPLMEGVQEAYREGWVKFSSLHNFCPLPVEITRAAPDCYEFSSHRAAERERAVKLTLQTIDFAARLGAPYVILHLGHVPMPRVTSRLVRLAENGGHLSRRYVRLKLEAVKKREARGPFYVERVRQCLEPIIEHAASKNVHLGIESRQRYEEIPNEREMLALLDEINSPYVGYWHDFGHVQTKHNLWFLDHYEWLSQIRHRLLGCHLHDCAWPDRDHLAPFAGGIDFDRLIPLLPKDTLMVFEMSPRRKGREIKNALAKWRERFGE